MAFAVLLTDDAAQDLREIFHFIAHHDAPEKADYVLGQLEKTLLSLVESPERGTFPKELLNLGIRDYREIYFKPYRILYRVFDQKVFVLLIADGRRDMQALLQRRLLEA